MNTIQRIFKNTGVLFIAQIINYSLAFFYTIYLARYLGVEEFGVLSFGLSFTLLMGVIADLGLSILTVREIARDKTISQHYTGNIIVLKLILCAVTLAFIILFINILNYPTQTIYVVYILGFWMVFTSFTQLFFSVFQAYEKMEYQGVGIILPGIILLFGVFYGISNNFSILWFALIYLISSLIGLISVLIIYLVKFPMPQLGINWDFWKSKMLIALPLSIASIFSTIAFRVDTVLLSLLQGDAAVGWYSASYKIIEILLFIPIVYNTAIFPVLSKFYVSSHESIKLVYAKSIKYLIILGLPLAAGITILSNDIILILYQSEFAPSVITLQILIWTIPLILLTMIFSYFLISMNKQVLIIRLTFIYMIFNIAVNLVVIPQFSYIGASVVTVLSELLNFIMLYYYLSKFICKVPIAKYVWKPVLATGIMTVFMSVVNINIFILVLISAILYLGLLILFKTFSESDVYLIKKLVAR
ncbi:MAG TPA: flippase [Methanobacterium sp.]|mgnify:FL=1|nr:MAG: flippase [Methanobacterium sp.]HOI72269.1 flippase [Methanobacterium sp.]